MRVEPTLCGAKMVDIEPQPTGTQVCFAYNRAKEGCAVVCPSSRAHVCEFCLEPHRTVECPRNPGWTPPVKGAGKGKGKNRGKK